MTTKNIQDVVAEKVKEFDDFLEEYTGEHANTFELAKIVFADTVRVRKDIIVNEFRTTLTQLVKEVEAGRDKQWLLYLAKWHRNAHDDLFDPNQSDRPILSADKIDSLTHDAYKEQNTPPTSDVTKEQPSE